MPYYNFTTGNKYKISMKKFSLPLLICLIISSMSCKTKENVFNPQTFQAPMITFGSGGGFTVQVNSFYLTSNGSLYASSHEGYTPIGKADKKITNQIFTNYEALGLKDLSLDEPGNKYYFIEYQSKNINKALKWGLKPIDNNNLAIYYNILLDLVRKMSSDEIKK